MYFKLYIVFDLIPHGGIELPSISVTLILMPKKIFYFLVVGCWLLVVGLKPILADDAPTPTTPPTCDICGWCNPETQPKPSNWDSCNRCLYTSDGIPREHTYYSAIGCLSTQSDLFVKSILSIVFGVAGGIAFLAVLAGSITVLTSSGNAQKLRNGKDIITSSIFGILLILFSVFLLRTVGFDILKIPGFG